MGDRNVLLEMLKDNYVVGGENSGHIIQLRHLSTGDGMLSAIAILNIMTETKKSLKELTSNFEIWPDKLVNLKVKDKKIALDSRIQDKVQETLKQYNNEIQLVIRPSGTENLLRVSCCAKKQSDVDKIIETFVTMIETIDKEIK